MITNKAIRDPCQWNEPYNERPQCKCAIAVQAIRPRQCTVHMRMVHIHVACQVSMMRSHHAVRQLLASYCRVTKHSQRDTMQPLSSIARGPGTQDRAETKSSLYPHGFSSHTKSLITVTLMSHESKQQRNGRKGFQT